MGRRIHNHRWESDITERKNAEEQIKSLARFPQRIRAGLRENMEGVILFANEPGWCAKCMGGQSRRDRTERRGRSELNSCAIPEVIDTRLTDKVFSIPRCPSSKAIK